MLYTPIRQAHLENVKDVLVTDNGIFNEIMNNPFAPILIGKLFYQTVEDYKLSKYTKKYKNWNYQSNDRKFRQMQFFLITSIRNVC